MSNSRLEMVLSTFLDQHLDPKCPLLLGLSGGPDSLALFHLLLTERAKRGFVLHIAHIDHGWRPESGEQARQLQELVEKQGVSFHCHTLDLSQQTGNAEDWARQERLRYFGEIVHAQGCQAVVLGHHADDLAETVLKRLFEGAALIRVAGLRAESSFDGLMLWRPLLTVHKAEILAWLEQRGAQPFDDVTNVDERFLRARMRQSLLPKLTQIFGKDVSKGLVAIGRECEELDHYLDAQTARYLNRLEQGNLGTFLDLSEECPAHDVELKHVMRRFCRQTGVQLSREALERACVAIRNGTANIQVASGQQTLFVDRRCLIALPSSVTPWPEEPFQLALGVHEANGWHIEVVPFHGQECRLGWQKVLHGTVQFVVPSAGACLHRPIPGDRYHNTSLDRWWTQHKVPAFMRAIVPTVHVDGDVYLELLSGQQCATAAWYVTLTK